MGQAKIRGTKEQRLTAIWDEYNVKALTFERYNAFIAWTRSPIARQYGVEIEYFSTNDENLIGVIIQDTTDRDFGYVTFARDEKSRFRCIDVATSLKKHDARHQLFDSMLKHSSAGETIYPQHDSDQDRAGVDLFIPLVPEGKQNSLFALLNNHEQFIPARSMISEMMHHFTDVDGNFVEQFQTTGFNSRVWELYLYAALLELDLFVEKPSPAPDFMVSNGYNRVYVEAVTVAPTGNAAIPDAEGLPKMRSPDEIVELLKGKMPIKFGSALHSKLMRKNSYWEMEHVKGNALVFAIADFHEDQSMTWSSTALHQYLYGVSHEFMYDESGQLIITPLKIDSHEFEGKKINSGFFFQDKAENVSAILFSASGTISKFNRMGKLAGFGLSNQRLYRMGVRHIHETNAALPTQFVYEIVQGKVTETWAEGLSMFHNPRAITPVDPHMFPGVAHHFFDEGVILSSLPDFHPYSSFTLNMLLKD